MEVSTKRKEIADKHQKMCRSTKKKGKSGKNHEKGVGKCKAFVELLVGGKWQENGRKTTVGGAGEELAVEPQNGC